MISGNRTFFINWFGRLSIVTKVTLVFSILVLAATTIVGYLVYSGNSQLLVNSSKQNLTQNTKVLSLQFSSVVQSLNDDIRFLSRNPALEGLVGAGEKEGTDAMVNLPLATREAQVRKVFTALLESRPAYLQVTLVGVKQGGRELIRVDQVDGILKQIPSSRLVPVSNEPFYKATTDLTPDKIFISSIGLYRERGQVHVPHIPTLQAALPMYNAQSELLAMLVVSLDLTPTFNHLKELSGPHTTLYLTNNLGDYLLHPHPSKTFGFETGKRWLLQDDFSQATELIEGGKTQLQVEEVYPHTEEPVILNLEREFIFNDHDRFLVLGVSQPYSTILSGIRKIRDTSFFLTLAICLLGMVLTFLFSGFLIRPLKEITKAVSSFAQGQQDVILPLGYQDEIGVLAGTFTVMASQLKKQIQELEYKEQSIRVIIETTIEGIIIFNEQAHIETFNQAAESILGYSQEEMGGQSVGEVLNIFQSSVWSGPESEGVMVMEELVGRGRETMARRKDGTLLHIYLSLSSFRVGEELKFTAVIHDITARKKVEEELIAAKQNMEEALKAKDEFLSVISHEIRTPMNAVIGMTRLLLQNDPSKKQLPIIHTLKFSGDNLMALINDILDFSKIQAGKIELEEVDVNLRELLHKMLLSHRPKADESNLALSLSIEDDVPDWVKGDSVRLFQILNNLVGNALKFTEKGRIMVEVKRDVLLGGKVGVLFQIEDTGIGIPPTRLPFIFDRFTQASSDTTRKYGGSGLGLAITKNLVELLGGTLEVQSEEGVGSTFTVKLAFSESAGVHPNLLQPEDASASLAGLRILYVEDVVYNQFLIENYLAKYQVWLDIASSGTEGVDKARNKEYDLILMDIQMPEMDGYQATTLIRTFHPLVPVLAVTALVSDQARTNIIASGMTDYLLKPVDEEELIRKIAKYTRGVALAERATPAVAQEVVGEEEVPAYADLEEAYDANPVKIRKALGMIRGEFVNYSEKFDQAIRTQNIAEFNSCYHKIRPHIRLLQLRALDEQLLRSKSLLTSSGADASELLPLLSTSFGAILADMDRRINEIDRLEV